MFLLCRYSSASLLQNRVTSKISTFKVNLSENGSLMINRTKCMPVLRTEMLGLPTPCGFSTAVLQLLYLEGTEGLWFLNCFRWGGILTAVPELQFVNSSSAVWFFSSPRNNSWETTVEKPHFRKSSVVPPPPPHKKVITPKTLQEVRCGSFPTPWWSLKKWSLPTL